MIPLILRAIEVQRILSASRTESYQIIREIKDSYPYSNKLKGSKIRTEDLADAYDLNLERIDDVLKS